MANVTFDCVNVPIVEASRALKMDCQTVRLLLQNRLVDWGIAYKRGNSQRYSYLIYPKKFYEVTGYLYQGETEKITALSLLKRYEELLNECELVLKEMQSTFLYDEEEINKLSGKCDKLYLIVDAIKDFIKGGVSNE